MIASPGRHESKPLLRGFLHELSFGVALSAGVLLVAAAPGEAKLGCGLYAASLAVLFGVSALYHRPFWPEPARSWLRRVDHSAIFVLIAGTSTPLALTLPAPLGARMLAVAWAGAALGIARALFFPRARRWVVVLMAVALGWSAAAYLPALMAMNGRTVILLLALGIPCSAQLATQWWLVRMRPSGETKLAEQPPVRRTAAERTWSSHAWSGAQP